MQTPQTDRQVDAITQVNRLSKSPHKDIKQVDTEVRSESIQESETYSKRTVQGQQVRDRVQNWCTGKTNKENWNTEAKDHIR